jgi:hypothetical protein
MIQVAEPEYERLKALERSAGAAHDAREFMAALAARVLAVETAGDPARQFDDEHLFTVRVPKRVLKAFAERVMR